MTVRKLLGISDGDLRFGKSGNVLIYALKMGFASTCRVIANNLPIPSLRIVLLSLSGISIGRGTQINMGVRFMDNFEGGRIYIGDNVAIAPNVVFVADSHPNNSSFLLEKGWASEGDIMIGDGSWICAGAVILPGITVGNDAIIGANSVVTRNVPDKAVVVGIPARVVSSTDCGPKSSAATDAKTP